MLEFRLTNHSQLQGFHAVYLPFLTDACRPYVT